MDSSISVGSRDLDIISRIVQTTTESIFQGPRTSSTKLKLFSKDVTLIALAIRTAYLVDAIVPRDPAPFFQELIQRLRKASSAFQHLFAYCDDDSGQSFIVNARLLAGNVDLCAQLHGTTEPHRSWTSFIRLEPPLALADRIPETVLQVLQEIRKQSQDGRSLVKLCGRLRVEDAVPLAAILLEYPVAYVPTSSAETSFLSGEALVVCECYLEQELTPSPLRHTLIKFSCPNSIAQNNEHLSPRRLAQRLQEHFAPRVGEMGEAVYLKIHISTETLDRVAL
ncbi:hypothetical protein FIBSPDRAFT_1036207 [Athelia psychrophila]|uniref:Uncharacterized protein n=1 Tax=Athelia psychrophila TaxID=1759441 RepID=A0A166WF09_9AGAM|nr:hypothetical protein FIBSPDRAFT_1036207 [Fibularhizoctonia sp. CBS 109695]